jgi:EAL domain-containing protein (putative c-di-GMP-specific phosphodiesterase class I)
MIQAIASLGTGLGLTTIAEGVETEAQAELARQAGVTDIQGFLISKAIPADDVASWITAYDAGPTKRRTSLER